MTEFNGPDRIITLDDPTVGVLNLSVETNLYSEWKEWVLGNYTFNTETDVSSGSETITIIDHSLHTGQDVIYDIAGPENIGLVDGTTYWVRRITRNTFELYDTQANSEAGPAVVGRLDLTASGVGDGEDHLLDADNSKFLAAFRTIGGDPLTPGVEAGGYFFLQNQDVLVGDIGDGWRIISTDEDQTVNYQGNLVGEDSSEQLIIVTPSRTVLHLGLQPVTQRVDEILLLQQATSYLGTVSYSENTGVAGTEYPIGTRSEPVNNEVDLRTILNFYGLSFVEMQGDLVLDAAYADVSFIGHGGQPRLDANGQNVAGASVEKLAMVGDWSNSSAGIRGYKVTVNEITGVANMVFYDSIVVRTITLAAGPSQWIACATALQGTPAPTVFDFDGTNHKLNLKQFSGDITLRNMTHASSRADLDMVSGAVTIEANCTAGTININGIAVLNDNSVGSTVNDTVIEPKEIRLIQQMVAGNATVSLDDLTVTVYDIDGVTVLATFTLSADGRIRTRTS